MGVEKRSFSDIVFLAVAVPFVLGLVYYYITGYGGSLQLAVAMVPYCFILYVLNALRKGGLYPRLGVKANYAIGLTYIAISAIAGFYFTKELWAIAQVRHGSYNIYDLFIGTLMAALVMEYARTKYLGIFVLNVFLIFYAMYGRVFPGILSHPGVPLSLLIPAFSAALDTGIFARLAQIALTLIAAFLLFAAILHGFGTLESLIRTLMGVLARRLTYVPQIAVVGSLCVAMVSGSGAANAAATGSFTIPLMMRVGLPGIFAASVETGSSLGGQIMPPIMGASAFVMADYLGVHYFDVVARAFLPALVYYLGVAFAVYLLTARSLRRSEKGDRPVERPAPVSKGDLVNVLIFLTGIGLLIYLLAIRLYVVYAAMLASIYILTALVARTLLLAEGNFREKLSTLRRSIVSTIDRFVELAVELTLLLSALGIAVAMFTITGVPTKIGMFMMQLGGENLALIVAIAFLFGWIVGLGLPPVATYIIVAVLISIYMVKLGINPWIIHFFAFFVALYSELSPPTSVTAAVTSRLAGSSFTRTMLVAHSVCTALFVLMFGVFTYPQLVIEPGVAQLQAGAVLALITLGIVFSVWGKYCERSLVDLPLRATLGASSLALLVLPSYMHLLAPVSVVLLALGLLRLTGLYSKFRTGSRAAKG